jgi:hypothetical protein
MAMSTILRSQGYGAVPCSVVDTEAALSSESRVRIWHNSRRHVLENRNIHMYEYTLLVRSRVRRLFGVTEVSL